MPRKKKTKEEKKRADMRKTASTEPMSQSLTYSFLPTSFSPMQSKETTKESAALTATIKHDLFKTAIISGIILCIQLTFFMLFKNHILALGFVTY